MREQDFTPKGMRLEGQWENDRNAESADLFKDIIREVYGVRDVIIGHHLVYAVEEVRDDGFTYTVVEEIPSADALLFDHDAMRRVFGEGFKEVLTRLAVEPTETRDKVLGEFYYNRAKEATA